MAYGVLHKEVVPPGGMFRCRQPGLSAPIQHPYFRETFNRVKAFRKANGLPTISEVEFEACVCQEQPDICGEVETGEPPPPTTAERIVKFGRSMYAWALNGFSPVSPEVYAERWELCKACPHWNGEPYFGYGACLQCGCSRLKLMATTEKCPIGKW